MATIHVLVTSGFPREPEIMNLLSPPIVSCSVPVLSVGGIDVWVAHAS